MLGLYMYVKLLPFLFSSLPLYRYGRYKPLPLWFYGFHIIDLLSASLEYTLGAVVSYGHIFYRKLFITFVVCKYTIASRALCVTQ